MKRNLKNFVDAGYKKKSEAKQIDNYILDEELSTKRDKVYYDPTTGKAVHTIAGTDSLKDWTNNALIPLGLHEYSNRYKNAESIQKKANEKYGKDNVDLVTHSQSGNIAENLANKNLVGGDNTTLNPAIIGSHNKSVKVVKSMLDPVSLLTNTNKNDISIMPKTFNPITEHSTNILEKTKNVFGFGIKAKRGIKSMKYTDEYSDSSSDEEMEGMGIDEHKILKKMNSLHNDIAKLHKKHGVKKSVIKGFKMLGQGIIRTADEKPEFRPAVMPPSQRRFTHPSGSGTNRKMPKLDENAGYKLAVMPSSYRTPPTPSRGSGLSKKEKDAQRSTDQIMPYAKGIDMSKNMGQPNVGGYNYIAFGSGLKGKGATGKMLKEAAAGATAGLINSGANRAIYEMDTQGKKGTGIKKGSAEMKERMAKMRAMRKCNKA